MHSAADRIYVSSILTLGLRGRRDERFKKLQDTEDL